MINLFKAVMPEATLHRNFKIVRDEKIGYYPARTVINELFHSHPQIDADFVQQFQTKGFDARIWELYLAASFKELEFSIEAKHVRPDFELLKSGRKIFVEAVTSNPAFNEQLESLDTFLKKAPKKDWDAIITQLREENVVRVASALTSKLKKKYWELDWVKGNSFVLAIETFHHSFALSLSDSSVVEYLYGFNNTWNHDSDGSLNIQTQLVTVHKKGDSSIPSNFFSLPGAENISAVLFSNSGTIAKFNRMGVLSGLGNQRLTMVRQGMMYDHDPNASKPKEFKYIVGNDGPPENWAQGLSMHHNPNAKFPIDRALFPGILHGYFDKEFHSFVPDFHPYQSSTTNHIRKK